MTFLVKLSLTSNNNSQHNIGDFYMWCFICFVCIPRPFLGFSMFLVLISWLLLWSMLPRCLIFEVLITFGFAFQLRESKGMTTINLRPHSGEVPGKFIQN